MIKLSMPSHLVLTCAAVLLGSNVVTGLVTSRVVRSQDFSQSNLNCLINWGGIHAQFADRPTYDLPRDPAQLYRIHERNARFDALYPNKVNADSQAVTLFCWGVAADEYHWKGKDVAVDPAIWRAFLTEGPKDLPIYWDLRQSLTREGAGRGLIRGDTLPWLKPVQPLTGTGNAGSMTRAAASLAARRLPQPS